MGVSSPSWPPATVSVTTKSMGLSVDRPIWNTTLEWIDKALKILKLKKRYFCWWSFFPVFWTNPRSPFTVWGTKAKKEIVRQIPFLLWRAFWSNSCLIPWFSQTVLEIYALRMSQGSKSFVKRLWRRRRRGWTSCYLEHVCVVVVAVLHHHRVVPGQSVGDAVLAFTVHSLGHKQQLVREDGAHNATGHLVIWSDVKRWRAHRSYCCFCGHVTGAGLLLYVRFSYLRFH